MWSARVFWFSKPKQMSAIASSSTVCKSFSIQRKFDIINHFKILGQIDRYKKRKEEVRRRRRPPTDQPYVSYQRSNRTFLGSWARAFALCSSLASAQRAARAAMSRTSSVRSVRNVDVVSSRARSSCSSLGCTALLLRAARAHARSPYSQWTKLAWLCLAAAPSFLELFKAADILFNFYVQ